MKPTSALRPFLLGCSSLLAASTIHAADVTWDITPGVAGVGNGTVTGGSGSWNTNEGLWTTDAGVNNITWVNAKNDTAVFGGTAGTVNIDTLDDLGVTVGGLTFSTASYIIAGAAGETLTFGAAGTISNSVTATISAVIAGSSTITKTGVGTLNLTATNTFTGDTVISGGTLVVGGNNTAATLGPANYAGNITNNGTLLQFTNSTSQNFSGIISGSGNLQKGGGGTLTLSGANTYTGKTIIAAPAAGGPTVSVSSLNSVDINDLDPNLPKPSSSLGAPTTVANGTIQLGSGSNIRACTLIYTGSGETTDRVMNVQFNSGNTHTIRASNTTGLLKFTSAFTITPSSGGTSSKLTIRGTGNGEIAAGFATIPGILEKNDSGTWTLGGSSFSDKVTVAAGTLVVNGSLTAKNATPSIDVNGTSTLGGSGTLSATTAGTAIVTVASGADLSPGTSVGTLTVDGTLNVSAMAGGTGTLNFEVGPIATSDKIVVANTLNIGTDVFGFGDFNFTALSGLQNGTYKLITSGTAVSGTLDPTPGNLTGTVGTGTGLLRISDGGTGNDIELVVSGITGGGNTFADWIGTYPGVSGLNGVGDDADGDGIDNGVENFFGTNPSVSTSGLVAGAVGVGTFTFTHPQNATPASDLTATYQWSKDLVTFYGSGVSDGSTTVTLSPALNTPGAGTTTVTATVTGTATSKLFVRVKVTQP